jgi:hypothetical protein
VAGDAQDLAVREGVASTGSYRSFVVCFPAARCIVVPTVIPAQRLVAAVVTMTAGATVAFTSTA